VGGTLASGAPAGSFNVLPTVVSTGAVNVIGAGTTFTIAPPASIVNGNLLVAVLGIAGNNSEVVTPAAGFTQIGSYINNTNGDKMVLSVWTKIAASESGNYTFTFSVGTTLGVAVITQLSGTTTVDASNTATANAALLTVPSFAVTNPNDLVLAVGIHTNGNPTTNLTSPGNTTQIALNNGMFVATLPNGITPVPAFNFTSYVTATLAAGSTNAFNGFVLAFTPSTISATTPLTANSSTAASSSGGLSVTGIQATGVIQANEFVVANSAAPTAAPNSYAMQLASGAVVPALSWNVSNNLLIDGGEHATQVSIGSGIKGGARLIVSSGTIQSVSVDATQDLPVVSFDASNNFNIGCDSAACAGQTEEADIFINAQTAHLVHTQVNKVDRFTPGDTKNLTSGVAATILSIPLAADQTAGGTVSWSSLATDTVNHLNCSTSGTVEYSAENSAGVFVVNTSVIGTSATACTATLTNACTFAMTSANPTLLQATCTLVNMAAPTSYVITYNVNHLSGTLPTF
jgi:hypothetical protein